MNNYDNFPAMLKKARKENGMTMEELAVRVGLSAMSIQRYVSGVQLPNMDRFLAVNNVLLNNDLVYAWRNTVNQNNDNIPINNEIKYAFLLNLINKGDKVFLSYLFDASIALAKMSPEGLVKAVDFLNVLSHSSLMKAEQPWVISLNQHPPDGSN